jgi:hypothetical protein
MKMKIMQLIGALIIASFSAAALAADSASPQQTTVHGKFTLPIYPGSTTASEPGKGLSGGMSYSYYSPDSVEVVYAWYKAKLPGGQERLKVPEKMVSYAVPGSSYVNVMVVIDKKGGSHIALSP